MPKSGFKRLRSVIGCDCSTNWPTTTAQPFYILEVAHMHRHTHTESRKEVTALRMFLLCHTLHIKHNCTRWISPTTTRQPPFRQRAIIASDGENCFWIEAWERIFDARGSLFNQICGPLLDLCLIQFLSFQTVKFLQQINVKNDILYLVPEFELRSFR